jgi:urea transport system substrate-binding protein
MITHSRRAFLRSGLAAGAGLAVLGAPQLLAAQDKRPIKVGVLHSLSGTMAISEARLKEVILMTIEEINAAGASSAERWSRSWRTRRPTGTSSPRSRTSFCSRTRSRPSSGAGPPSAGSRCFPSSRRTSGLLFYPVQYEGEECSKNVIYTGAAINQQATPGVDYLMSADGGSRKKFYLLGTDYVYPRTTNKILRMYFTKTKGVPESAIAEEYTPFHHQDYRTIVGRTRRFAAGGDAAVINTINGDSNVPFFKELANQGVTADRCPVMSFSVAEVELQTLDVRPSRATCLIPRTPAKKYPRHLSVERSRTGE